MKCVALPKIDPAAIPPRPWVYGSFLLRGQTAVLAAVDGGGKGAMAVVIMLSIITGRPLLDERVWRTGPVAVVTYEDDMDEWQRRIAAACDHYGVDYLHALDNIRFLTRPRDRIVIAATHEGQTIFPDGDDMAFALCAMGAAMLIVDPLNHAHGFEDGNNNTMMAKVAAELNRIASDSGAAILVLHHLRKGSTGHADDMMGATSIRATFRSSRILARMTVDDARPLGLEREAWRYSRVSGSKENYAPPPDKATWYRLASMRLNNGTEEYPDGDTIQVTTTWTPPPIFEGVDVTALTAIFQAIRTGLPAGERHSPNRNAAKRWVGQSIMDATGMTAERATLIVKKWFKDGVLKKDTYKSPATRRMEASVILDEVQAAAIIGQIQPFSSVD